MQDDFCFRSSLDVFLLAGWGGLCPEDCWFCLTIFESRLWVCDYLLSHHYICIVVSTSPTLVCIPLLFLSMWWPMCKKSQFWQCKIDQIIYMVLLAAHCVSHCSKVGLMLYIWLIFRPSNLNVCQRNIQHQTNFTGVRESWCPAIIIIGYCTENVYQGQLEKQIFTTSSV